MSKVCDLTYGKLTFHREKFEKRKMLHLNLRCDMSRNIESLLSVRYLTNRQRRKNRPSRDTDPEDFQYLISLLLSRKSKRSVSMILGIGTKDQGKEGMRRSSSDMASIISIESRRIYYRAKISCRRSLFLLYHSLGLFSAFSFTISESIFFSTQLPV